MGEKHAGRESLWNSWSFWSDEPRPHQTKGATLAAQWWRTCLSMQKMQIPSLRLKIPWKRKWQPTPGFLAGKSQGQRSLAGYSPWGCKESDTTERLNNSNSIKLRGPCIRAQLIAKADVYWSFQFSIQHRNRLCVYRIASLWWAALKTGHTGICVRFKCQNGCGPFFLLYKFSNLLCWLYL